MILPLALAALMTSAAVPEPVFREDFADGRPASGGQLRGEAKVVDCVFGKALRVPGKAGSYALYPAGKLRGLEDFTLTLWFKMNRRTRDAKGNVPLNGFAALDWAWWFDLNGGALCGHFGALAADGDKRAYALSASIGDVVSPEEWTHAALVYSPKGNVMRVFVNGILKSESHEDLRHKGGILPINYDKAGYLFLGSVAGCHFADGEIARVRLYPQALAAEEVAAREADAVKALGAPSLAEVGVFQRTARLRAKDRKLAGGKDLYWGVVDPMGYAVYRKDSDIPAASGAEFAAKLQAIRDDRAAAEKAHRATVEDLFFKD